MVRMFLTAALVLAACKSESPPREAPKTGAQPSPAREPAAAPTPRPSLSVEAEQAKGELDDIEKRLATAADEVAAAANDADRAAANAKLEQLRQEQVAAKLKMRRALAPSRGHTTPTSTPAPRTFTSTDVDPTEVKPAKAAQP